MKICMMGIGIAKPNNEALVGAHVNNVANLSKQLVMNGHEVHLVTTYHPLSDLSSSTEDLCLPWTTIHPIRVSGRYSSIQYGLRFILKAILKIRKLHEKENFDVIHGHSGFAIMGLIPGLSGRIKKIPSVHTLYCPINHQKIDSRGYQIFSHAAFAKCYLSRLDVIISLSNNIKESLKNTGIPNGKIKVVPPCIDLSLFNIGVSGEQVKKVLKINEHPTLLFLGNASKTKGLEVLVDALKVVVDIFPNTKLLLGLDTSIEKYIPENLNRRLKIEHKIQSSGLKDNVIQLGIIKNMPQVMAACDIFVSPFISTDGPADYPLSILEAMAVGKPVVASKVGGIPEIVKQGENGILVEPNDVNLLSEAIVSLLEDEQKVEMMGKKGYNLIRNNFSIEKIVEKMEKIYEETIK